MWEEDHAEESHSVITRIYFTELLVRWLLNEKFH